MTEPGHDGLRSNGRHGQRKSRRRTIQPLRRQHLFWQRLRRSARDTEFHPLVLNWGGTIQYSMPYLKSAVIDLGLPDIINRLIPLQANLQTRVANTVTSGTLTTGTINPGIIWVGNTFQSGVEALIPINRQSGSNIGVIAQLHY